MRRYLVPAMIVVAAAAPAAAKSGRLSTLTLGRYVCERPGSAGSQATEVDAATSFRITAASRYVGADGTHGTYLRTGDMVEMTSGVLTGTKLVRLRDSFLRVLGADGLPGPTRCVLSRTSDKH